MNVIEVREAMSNQLRNVIPYLENKIRAGEGDLTEYKNDLERVKKLYDELQWFKSEY
jgi:hypothetical protein